MYTSIFLTPDGPCCSTAKSTDTWASRTCWMGGRSGRLADPTAAPNGGGAVGGRAAAPGLPAGSGPARTAGSGISPEGLVAAGSPVGVVAIGAGGVATGAGATTAAGAATSCGATGVGMAAPAVALGTALTEFA